MSQEFLRHESHPFNGYPVFEAAYANEDKPSSTPALSEAERIAKIKELRGKYPLTISSDEFIHHKAELWKE